MTAAEPVGPRRDRVLILYLAQLSNVARVLRQIDFLRDDYDITVAAFDAAADLDGAEFVQLTDGPGGLGPRAVAAGRVALRLAGQYRRAYWLDPRVRRWSSELESALPVAAVVLNSLYGLPLALSLGAPVVFDAHEHWTSESASWTRLQRLSMRGAHDWLVDRHVPQTAGVMTVSDGILRDMHTRTAVSPSLVTNAPLFQALRPSPVGDVIRLLHFGVADERRRLEDTIDAVRLLGERFRLDLVLARDNAYRRRLEREIANDERIRILPPVPNAELITFANAYDVGVFLLPPRFPNQVHVLPNKLFDYIQARLAVVIGPSEEMAAIVREWDCGIVSDSFTPRAFAEALGSLTVPEVERLKSNADRAAHVLNAERNREVVLDLVRQAIATRARPQTRSGSAA